jgi:transcriptional regulator with GAF, ATPase, and Fis domain
MSRPRSRTASSSNQPADGWALSSRQLELISRASREMMTAESTEQVLRAIAEGTREVFDAALVRVWARQPDAECPHCSRSGGTGGGSSLHLRASAGLGEQIDGPHHRSPVLPVVANLADARTPTLLPDLSSEPRIIDPAWVSRHKLQSAYGLPLISRGELLGVLTAFMRRPGDQSTLDRMAVFAAFAATTLQTARLIERLKDSNERALTENKILEQEVVAGGRFDGIIGNSPALKAALWKIQRVAKTDTTVLLLGETGTGKELAARAIHKLSKRRDLPLIRVNSAAIPPSLVDSELFGHEKGAFTGAHQRRLGRFELANRGTLFLDEVGDLQPDMQSRLLRALEQGEIERVGGEGTIKIDVRLIAATNRDLPAAIASGAFRADLYYRLDVFPIVMPPLRERIDDIPLLVKHSLALIAKRLGQPQKVVSNESMQLLEQYSWPGNIRELHNVLERACVLASGRVVEVKDPALIAPVLPATPADTSGHSGAPHRFQTLEELDTGHIRLALESTSGRIDGARGAARLLGLHPNTLRSRMERLGISK